MQKPRSWTPCTGQIGQRGHSTLCRQSLHGARALHTCSLALSSCSDCLPANIARSCPAAGVAGSSFGDLNDRRITQMGQSISGNLLANANIAPGAKADVTGFLVQGTSQVITPGGAPVTLNDLRTGKPMGKLTIQFDGTYVFEPAPGFTGAAPAVSLYLQSIDKLTTTSALALEVLPSECQLSASCWCPG